MRMIAIALSLIAGAFVVAAVVFVGYGRERSWERLAGSPDRGRFDLMTAPRSPTPNDAVAASVGLRADADIVLPAYEAEATVLLRQIAAAIESADPLARRVDDGTDSRHLRYVTYSPGMRFPDLVSIEAVAMDDGRTGLLLYARAQLGRSDFGANRRRLKLYLDGL